MYLLHRICENDKESGIVSTHTTAESAEEVKAFYEADALLDEIDGLLEVNAAEFVAAYVQKGGQ